MGKLKFRATRPPRGFYYIQSESRLKIDGEDYGALMKKVLSHRQYKGFPRATLAEVQEDVERQICARLTERECTKEGTHDELRPVTENQVLSLNTAMKFSGAALAWLATGAKVVEVEQLNTRQGACLVCPLNNPVPSCKCSVFYKLINKAVPEARRNDGLFVCSACACSLNAKVQMPLEMVLKADEGRAISYPPNCWVRLEQGK